MSEIAEHMAVFAADGEAIGRVDHMQDGKIKLTKNDSPDHQHHLIPMSWVQSVGAEVRLNKTLSEIRTIVSGSPNPTDAVPEAGKRDAVP